MNSGIGGTNGVISPISSPGAENLYPTAKERMTCFNMAANAAL
jgi:hypothetical protein